MEDENRDCNRGVNKMACKDCSYTTQGINAAFGYNTPDMIANNVNNNSCGCGNSDDPDCSRADMLNSIKSLNFAVIELGLYLNTHPDDEKALCLHREYCRQLRDLKDKYQKVYGPLSIYFPCNKWRWLEEPWPWEGGNI